MSDSEAIELASQVCQWTVSYYSPQRILIIGKTATAIAKGFEDLGIDVLCFIPDQYTNQVKPLISASINKGIDLVVLCLAPSDQLDGSFVPEFFNELLTSDHLLVAIPLELQGHLLPDISKGLWELGFVRNLSIQQEIGSDLLLYPYLKATHSPSVSIESYEIELNRFQQISQKRGEIIAEFREDFYREIRVEEYLEAQIREKIRVEEYLEAQIREKNQVIADLEFRWDAFQNSRTGKMIKQIERVRQTVLPSGGLGERSIRSVFRTFKVIKNEGVIHFVRAIPGRLSRKIRWNITRYKLRNTRVDDPEHIGDITPIRDCPVIIPHTEEIDIIICVHNALDDIKTCLRSVREYTANPYRIILVDDGSGSETAQFLADYARLNSVTLLRSDEATGYTRAANRGLRESHAEYAVLLNSDTIVTPGWLDNMVNCAKSNPNFGIVGPLSNTASWQSVPKIEDHGDWAENPLSDHLTVEIMGGLVSNSSAGLYPEMPFLNGFCIMIRRELLEQIGLFDEENFGAGYGEENDFALRARKAGWKLALADNTYIYHAQSKSYSTERRKMLSERAGVMLARKHGESMIQEGVEYCHYNRVLEGIRARAEAAIQRHDILQQGLKYAGRRILFILPISAPGGGGNVVRAESAAMIKMGVDVQFYNLRENRAAFSAAYPNLEIPVIYGDIEEIPNLASDYDAVISTYNPSVGWIEDVVQTNGKPVRGYYVQEYEPLMYPENTPERERAFKSYSLFPDLVRFTKTDWTQKVVFENTGQSSHIIGVSYDIDLYRPRPRSEPDWPYRPLRIAAMVRPESAYRGPAKTMQLLKRLSDEFGGAVEICIFGTRPDNPDFLALPRDFAWKLYGILPPQKVANFLNQMDIFIDYSSHQAMGLTALEAMSCGCAVVVPSNGGATSFARHEHNSIIVDTSSPDLVWEGVKRLVSDNRLRASIQRNAIYDVCAYFPERAALNILKVIFEER